MAETTRKNGSYGIAASGSIALPAMVEKIEPLTEI